MKASILVMALAGGGLLAGCNTTGEQSAGPAYSARELSAATEDRARQIYKNGGASSMDEARTKAYADVNAQWAKESRKARQNASEARMTKELTRMGY